MNAIVVYVPGTEEALLSGARREERESEWLSADVAKSNVAAQ